MPIPKHSSYYEDVAQQPTSWSYLFIHHMAVKSFQKWLEAYNADDTRPTKQGSYNIVVFLTICISYANNCFTL